MRIKQLNFQNLNSLVGEWSIDFSDSSYLANGIFAITGPTGAGKTTILDAICLALYGRTPRLNRVNKSGNEIMSRQTGQCYAELSFETREGQYRCHWSQQRARKKTDGELQNPKHEIADLGSGKVLESKMREVAALVEKITGMNFEQFTRSILLAQGGFAAFLQAPADERAPILEQITGTEIYSEISIKVHQRRSDEKSSLDNLQAEMTGIKILSEEEEQVLREGLQTKEEQARLELEKLNSQREAVNWLGKIAGLEKEISILDEQWQSVIIREEAFKPENQRLERARQAMLLDGSYVNLTALREQQNNDWTELNQIKEELPLHSEALAVSNLLLEDAAKNLEGIRSNSKKQGEIIKQVRDKDLLIKQQIQRIKGSQALAAENEEACAVIQGQIDQGIQQRQEINLALADIELYISQNSMDASLQSKISGIVKSFAQVQDYASRLERKQIEREQAAARQKAGVKMAEAKAASYAEKCSQLLQAEEALRKIQEELHVLLQGREAAAWRLELEGLQEQRNLLREANQSLSRIKQAEARLKQEQESSRILIQEQELMNTAISAVAEKIDNYERELKQLENNLILLSRIRDLEAERAYLEDGKACPLCGATEHPFAQGNLPAMDEAESARNQVRDHLKKLNRDANDLRLRKAKTEKDFEFSETARQEQNLILETESESCRRILTRLGMEAVGEGSLDQVQNSLNNIEETIEVYTRTLNEIEAGQKSERRFAKQYDECKLAMVQAANEQQQVLDQQQQDGKESSRLQSEYESLQAQLGIIHQEALLEVSEYGIAQLVMEEMPEVLEKLRDRQASWTVKQDARKNLEQSLVMLQNGLTKQETLLETRKLQMQRERESLEEQESEVKKLQDLRWELYEDRDPALEEERLDCELQEAGQVLEKARKDLDLAQYQRKRLEEREVILGDKTQSRALELQAAEAAFGLRLQDLGFEHENDYLQATLPSEEQQALTQEAGELRDQKTELQTRLLDRKEILYIEKERKLTDQTQEDLEEKRRLSEQELKVLQDSIGADKHMLQSSAQNRIQMQEQMQKIEIQKNEYRRWDLLHNLIGSADGKKFRNFAQGLTFDIMISHANRQLQKMNDRYLLLRNHRQALDLNVIDKYQAGEIRSTANLSGGESFLVSLALALGLSYMASRKVSVDSLFLDEGFGALDEDALDIALDTLAGLQRDGKLIGVISHVPALKERIANQIQVISKSGGRSILQGPGCQQIKA